MKASTLSSIKARLEKIAWPWKHQKERFRLLREAAALGDADAHEELGMWYRDGDKHLNKNLQKSIWHFRRAAELGSVMGMHGLADALTSPFMRPSPPKRRQDLIEGLKWYRKASRTWPEANYNLGVTLQYLGNHKKAYQCFRRASYRGDSSALMKVALAELHGVGTRRDVSSALEKLKRIANMTGYHEDLHLPAMVMIAQILREGILVPRDYKSSLQWLKRAAKKGSKAAQGILDDEWL